MLNSIKTKVWNGSREMKPYFLLFTVLIVANNAKQKGSPNSKDSPKSNSTGRFGWPKATCKYPKPDNLNKYFAKYFDKEFGKRLVYGCKLNNRAEQYMQGRPAHPEEKLSNIITMDVYKMKLTPKKLAKRLVKEESNQKLYKKLRKTKIETEFGCAYGYEKYEEQVQLKGKRKFVAYVKRTNTTVICLYRPLQAVPLQPSPPRAE